MLPDDLIWHLVALQALTTVNICLVLVLLIKVIRVSRIK